MESLNVSWNFEFWHVVRWWWIEKLISLNCSWFNFGASLIFWPRSGTNMTEGKSECLEIFSKDNLWGDNVDFLFQGEYWYKLIVIQ